MRSAPGPNQGPLRHRTRALPGLLLCCAVALGVAACDVGGTGDDAPPPEDASGPEDASEPEDASGPDLRVAGPMTWSSVAPYSDDSPWNQPLAADVPIHPRSADFVERLGDTLFSDVSQYTLPVYEVDGETANVEVEVGHLFSHVDDDGTSLDRRQEATVEVPVPDGAAAATGTDAQVVIVDTDTGDEWGFWHFEPLDDGDGYRATNGYRYHVGWNAVPPEGFGSRGAGVPYLTGLIRPEQIADGRIDHAIAFAYPTPSPEHVFPATKSDGPGEPGVDLPEGARLRLDPSLDDADFDDWGLSDEARIVARALQEYGMILIDIAGRTKIYAEYEDTAGWDGAIHEELLADLPMEHFDVLDWEADSHGPLAQPTAPDRLPAGGDLVLDGSASWHPDGEVDRYEWTDASGQVISDRPVTRLTTDDLEPGLYRFGLRVADGDEWSPVRHLHVEIVEETGPFVAATYEAAGSGVDRLEVDTGAPGDDATMVAAVTLRRLNPDDDVAVRRVTGSGTWQRAVREVDERGTVAVEIWVGEPSAGARDGVEIELTGTTNAAAQVLSVDGVGEAVATTAVQPGRDQTERAELDVEVPGGGLAIGVHAGRTEDFTADEGVEVNVANTTAQDDEGGSVRVSTMLARPDGDDEVRFAGATRSPMDWAAAALAFEAR